jgi:hypothetical protein
MVEPGYLLPSSAAFICCLHLPPAAAAGSGGRQRRPGQDCREGCHYVKFKETFNRFRAISWNTLETQRSGVIERLNRFVKLPPESCKAR